MKQLFENFRGYITEEEDPLRLDPSLNGEQVAAVILAKISEVADVPADAAYKKGAQAIHFTNFGSLKDRHAIIQAMISAGLASEGKVKRLGMYDRAVTNFYIPRKNGNQKFIPITLNQGGRTMAAHGNDSENLAAEAMNSFFAANDLGMEYVAVATGGSGHGDDVEVKNPETEKTLHSYEIKASKGSRVDFGQFTISYSPTNGWQQATGTSNKTFNEVFSILAPVLNAKVGLANIPAGPGLKEKDAVLFWQAYEPGRTKSLSGNVLAVKIPPQLIEDYYAAKGNQYIILGDDIYSLGGPQLPSLASVLEGAQALFRIKDHGRRHSYTVTLRASFKETEQTDFNNAMKAVYLT